MKNFFYFYQYNKNQMKTGRKGTLTPEQLAQIRQYGNGTQVAEAPQQPNNVKHINNDVPLKQEEIANEEVYENNASNLDYEEKKLDTQTYFEYTASNKSKLELDLITFREKGVETRYLSIAIAWPEMPSGTMISIGSKEEFERFKEFVAQLNWGD